MSVFSGNRWEILIYIISLFSVLCSLFSVGLLSVQEVVSQIYACFRFIGYDYKLVERWRLKKRVIGCEEKTAPASVII